MTEYGRRSRLLKTRTKALKKRHIGNYFKDKGQHKGSNGDELKNREKLEDAKQDSAADRHSASFY